MKLTRKQTIEAARYCTTISNCATCCMFGEHDCRAKIIRHALHYLKENEPASAGTETSSKTKDTNITINNTPKSGICQEEIDTTSCTGEVIAGLKFMYPNAVIKSTMTNDDCCYVDFKCRNKNYSLCLSHDTYADKQETDNDQN